MFVHCRPYGFYSLTYKPVQELSTLVWTWAHEQDSLPEVYYLRINSSLSMHAMRVPICHYWVSQSMQWSNCVVKRAFLTLFEVLKKWWNSISEMLDCKTSPNPSRCCCTQCACLLLRTGRIPSFDLHVTVSSLGLLGLIYVVKAALGQSQPCRGGTYSTLQGVYSPATQWLSQVLAVLTLFYLYH